MDRKPLTMEALQEAGIETTWLFQTGLHFGIDVKEGKIVLAVRVTYVFGVQILCRYLLTSYTDHGRPWKLKNLGISKVTFSH